MNYFSKQNNLVYQTISIALIVLHLITFGPIRDAFAFSAQSASYKLSAGAMTSGGINRAAVSAKLWQDVIAEPSAGRAQSASYVLDSGFLPTIQPNPPVQNQPIPNQSWLENSGLTNVFDLDDFFASDNNSALTYSVSGKNKINVNISAPPPNYTKLLLHSNGADSSTAFVDEAGNSVTAQGNAQIDTGQSVFGGASLLLDGAGDYVTVQDSSDWAFGTGDFTVEGRIRFNVTPGNDAHQVIFSKYTDGNNYWFFSLYKHPTTNRFYPHFFGYVGGVNFNYNNAPLTEYEANKWYHVAWVRTGATLYFFLDGVRLTVSTNCTTNIPALTSALCIGKDGITNARYFNGWIDELRVSKGIARWTSNFTPPTAAYIPESSVTPSTDTKLLLHNNGADASIAVVDETGKSVTAQGNAQIDTAQSKFGGASVLLDGNGDYLKTPDSIDFDFGTGDFTIDCWFRLNSLPALDSHYALCGKYDSNSGYEWFFTLYRNPGNGTIMPHFLMTLPGNSFNSSTNVGVLDINTWYHLAFVRNGNACSFFLNGVKFSGSKSFNGESVTVSSDLTVGYHNGRPFNGWIDELRISKGIARWTANFTPTTAPYGLNTDSGNVVSFSQAPAWFGTEKIKFTATDNQGNSTTSNEITLQVQGVENPPILDFIPDITANEGALISIVPHAVDLDGDAITYSFTLPLNAQGQWQTNSTSSGIYTVTVTATDTTGRSDSKTVKINVTNVNRPPIFSPISAITVNEGQLVTVSPQAVDPDAQPLTFYYPAPLDNTGKWLTGYNDAGVYNLTITVSDGIDTATQPVRITVNNTNRPPQAGVTLSKYTVNLNEVFNITVTASDPDSNPMTFSLKKDGVEIASGAITGSYSTTASFASTGGHTISATVTDSGGLVSTDTKGVDVADPNVNRDYINPVLGDFNGDALTDLGLHNSQTGLWEICLSDQGVFRNAVSWQSGFGTSRDWWPMAGDYNGDGKTDAAVYNNTNGQLQVALSTGSGFSTPSLWLTVTFSGYSWQPVIGNFNGDKYPDFGLYNKDSGEVRIALGTGNGFGAFTTWITNYGNDYIALGGDFNGDSLTDLCLFKKSTGELKVAFSNTKAFVDDSTWLSGFGINQDVMISDYNNDGLADIGYWDKTTFNWQYAASTGAAFVNKGIWFNFGTASDESVTTGDFNGDGVIDTARFDRDQIGITRWNVRLSTDKPADFLTEIDNGIGGKTQITYSYAALGDNAQLPFPVYVASTVNLVNTFPADRAASYTQNFAYSGGYFDFNDREFRGFAKVRVTDPITNNYAETYFYQGSSGQDGALKGQIDRVVAFDGNNRKISETLNTYEVRKAGPESRCLGFAALIESVSTVWEENASFITTRDKSVYDNIGNVIEAISEGDTAKTGDEKSALTTYAQAYVIGFNRPTEVVLKDKDGNIVSRKQFEYDAQGNLTKEEVNIFDPLALRTTLSATCYTYDSFGNVITSTNPLGVAVTTEYDTLYYAFPLKVINSLSQSISYEYNYKLGVVTKTIDPNGVSSLTSYDSLGRILRVTKDDGRGTLVTAVTYSYPDFNTKITTNALNLSSSEYIDGIGRKYKTISQGESGALAKNVVSEVFYNARGQTSAESLAHYVDEPAANISYIRYEYDLRGRIKKTISDFPGTSSDVEASINYISPLYVETLDPQGHKKGTLKDVHNNIIEVTEFTSAGVYKTTYEHDVQNNLIKLTDSQGNISQMFYDSIGRKLKMIDPDMGTWTYEYDLAGNLLKQTDAKGQVLGFEYDVLNRLVKKTRDDGRGTMDVVNYLYDEAGKANCVGRLSKVTDSSGSTEFFYDRLGREIKSVKSVELRAYSVEREYDILDRLTKLTYPDGEIVNYSYDANSGLLEKVQGASSYVQDIAYGATGQINSIKYGNNVLTSYTYGQDLRLARIATRDEGRGTWLQDLNYLFDKNGNVTTLTDNLRSNIRSYTYDDLGRLTLANNVPSPSGGYANFSYQYNSIGNMTYKSDLGVMTYGANAGPHALTSAGGYTYQYDANGNMVVGKNKTLAYDVENRLIRVNESGIISTFSYDGDGGRVSKTRSANGVEQKTIYIGSLFEIDSDGKTRKHIFAGANRVCTIEAQSSTPLALSYYHSDHLGSSSVITDATGLQVEHYEYTPYGTTAVSDVSRPSSLVHHKFTGKELDSTNLYYYGARYYDPEIGRFITADTIVQAPYNPQTLNRYSYCVNNPINYIDPTGHFVFVVAIIGAIIGAIVGGAAAAISGENIWKGMLCGAISGFGAGMGSFWGAVAWGAFSGAANAAINGGNIGIGALTGGGGAGVGYGLGSWAKGWKSGSSWGRMGASTVAGGISGGLNAELSGGSFGRGAGMGAAYGAGGYVVGSAINNIQQFRNWGSGNGFKSDANVQAYNNQIAKLQTMLDEAYAQGGVEQQISVSVEIVSVNPSTTVESNRTLDSLRVTNNPKSDLPMRLMGYYVTGVVGVGAGFVGGPIVGAATGLGLGLIWKTCISGNINPGKIMGSYLSTITGLGAGYVGGPVIGKISAITIGELWNSLVMSEPSN